MTRHFESQWWLFLFGDDTMTQHFESQWWLFLIDEWADLLKCSLIRHKYPLQSPRQNDNFNHDSTFEDWLEIIIDHKEPNIFWKTWMMCLLHEQLCRLFTLKEDSFLGWTKEEVVMMSPSPIGNSGLISAQAQMCASTYGSSAKTHSYTGRSARSTSCGDSFFSILMPPRAFSLGHVVWRERHFDFGHGWLWTRLEKGCLTW